MAVDVATGVIFTHLLKGHLHATPNALRANVVGFVIVHTGRTVSATAKGPMAPLRHVRRRLWVFTELFTARARCSETDCSSRCKHCFQERYS